MENDKEIEEIMKLYPKKLTDSIEKYQLERKLRILELLKKAGVTEEDYSSALEYSPKGYTVV